MSSTFLDKLPFLHRNVAFAWTVFFVSVGLTLGAAYISAGFSEKVEKERFELRSQEISEAINSRLNYYKQSLIGAVGLFHAKDTVTRSDFKNYVAELKLSENLRGMQGLGYAIPVDPQEKLNFEKRIAQEGFKDFEITPSHRRNFYSAILYLEPFDWRNQRAFGYDMFSNDLRRVAMRKAVSTGKSSASGIITLVQETEQDMQKGFLIYVPVFRKGISEMATYETRMKQLKGWVYSPFRGKDFMLGILGSEDVDYEFDLFIGDVNKKENCLYSSSKVPFENHTERKFYKEIAFENVGQKFNVCVYSKPTNASLAVFWPMIIGGLGLVIDILLFWFLISLEKSRKQAKQLAETLEQQKKDLENVNWGLSQFAYLTSHDLQEPLRTVTSYVELFQQDYSDQVDEKGNFILTTISNATKRMSALIKAILDYSRLGKAGLTYSRLNTNQLMQEIAIDLQSRITCTKTQLNWSDLPQIEGDYTTLKQLFSNLISNGIKYQNKDTIPQVTVRYKEKRQFHQFEVVDNGIGIKEEYREKVFEVFQRLHTKGEYEGTGIGLSICKKIVDLHNGEIRVLPNPSGGSIFQIKIPKKQL